MHLDKLRHNTDCLSFILNDELQHSLQNFYKNVCNEDLKRRYADLFTLIDEFEDFKSVQEELLKKTSPSIPKALAGNASKKNPSKRLKAKVKSKKSHSTSSSDSDVPERDVSKQPPRKKHKTIIDDNESS